MGNFEGCHCLLLSHHHRKPRRSPKHKQERIPLLLPPRHRPQAHSKTVSTSIVEQALIMAPVLREALQALPCILHHKSISISAQRAQYRYLLLLHRWDIQCHKIRTTSIFYIRNPRSSGNSIFIEVPSKGYKPLNICHPRTTGFPLPLHLLEHTATATSLHQANSLILLSTNTRLRILPSRDIHLMALTIRHQWVPWTTTFSMRLLARYPLSTT